MANESTRPTATEAVALLEDAESLQAAIDDLLSHGFDRAELSLLSSAAAVEEKLGRHFIAARKLEDDDRVPRSAYVSPDSLGDAEGGLVGGLMYVGAVAAAGAVVASGGTLAAAIAGAATMGSAGGLVGAVLATLIDEHHARYLEEQLNRGGLLLWVRTRDSAHEARAKAILSRHSAYDVHLHRLLNPAEA